MDIELLRTFLEVNRTRHFAAAARNLFVTQAAVSARVRLLEEIVGGRVFTRDRGNIQLTVTGHRLIGHAETILNTWNRALREAGAQDDSTAHVALGCLPSLWEMYLTGWLQRVYREVPSVLLQVELLSSQTLVPRVREQSLSLGLLYEPPQTSDLTADRITEVELMLVSTTANLRTTGPMPNYVYVDWGTSFAMSHSTLLPAATTPVLRVDTPSMALDFLLGNGGTAYLPRPMLNDALATGKLHQVPHAASFDRSVYLVRGSTVPIDKTISGVIKSLQSMG
jgi:DNA-binding transcriptional LysR family regulator